jgi:hypothetical protein
MTRKKPNPPKEPILHGVEFLAKRTCSLSQQNDGELA